MQNLENFVVNLKQMCTVELYHICSRKTWIICRKASLPSPGGMDLGCGITFYIFTHAFTRVVVLNLLK